MAYLGKTPSQAVRSRYYFTASGGETSLSPSEVTGLSFTDANYVDVSLNGVALVSGTDYTATPSTNTISGLSALTASDVVEIVVYDTFSVFGGNVNGDFNISGGTLAAEAVTVTSLTTTGDISFGDNDKAIFGAGNDLQIYHDGNNSLINDLGTGDLRLRSNGSGVIVEMANGNDLAQFLNSSGEAKLMHNGSEKLATTSTGVDVTGSVTLDAAGNVTDGSGRPTVVLNNTSSGGWSTGTEYGSLEFHTDDTTSGAGLRAKISAKTGGTNGSRGVLGFTTRDSSGTTVETMTMDDTGVDVTGTVTAETSSTGEFNGITIHQATNSSGDEARIQFKRTTDAGSNREVAAIVADRVGGNDTALVFETNTDGSDGATERVRINQDGNVGIGTSSPADRLHVFNGSSGRSSFASNTDLIIEDNGNSALQFASPNTNVNAIYFSDPESNTAGVIQYSHSTNEMSFDTNDTTRMTIDSGGNLLHQRTSNSISGTSVNKMTLGDGTGQYGVIVDVGSGSGYYGFAKGGTYNSRIRYDYTGDFMALDVNGAERMRIDSSGRLLVGTTSTVIDASPVLQVVADQAANFQATVSTGGGTVLNVDRANADGNLIRFRQAGTTEGTISVSGSTVSYNGGHLSRWSQLADGTEDLTIVKGTVMTNLDQMAVWTKDGVTEDNEQLNCMAVSSVEGDANVAGVFVNWDNHDDDFNDMNVAMTGDMVIRIAQGTTVARGDLLMSAGDGTAKPQGDDIVRSKTIAKVTSTNVSHTYDDGTYLVPCVLMAC